MTFVFALLLIGFFSAALFGWGALFCRITNTDRNNTAVVIVLGLSTWVFLGGILNALSLAYSGVLDAVALLGIVLCALQYKDVLQKLPREKSLQVYAVALFAVMLIIMGFVTATQLPPEAYNFHDDYEKYFAHPQRMLQTGTLFGSALSAIGSETLGGQAFLQGFILSNFSFEMLNGFDAVFCLFLCLILVGSAGWGQTKVAFICLLSVVLVIVINPQYVNISALYSASALVIALVLYMSQPGNIDDVELTLPNPVSVAIMFAALVAIKMTFIPYVIVYFLVIVVSVMVVTRTVRIAWQWAYKVTLWGLLFIAPWILLHAPHYIQLAGAEAKKGLGVSPEEDLQLFSSEPLWYGASFLHYTLLAVGILLLGILMFYAACKDNDLNARRVFIAIAGASISGALVYFFLIIVFGPLHAGYDHALRYSLPVLIGLSAIVFPVFARYLATERSDLFSKGQQIAFVVIVVAMMIGFSPAAIKRFDQAMSGGSILAFSSFATSEKYLQYNREVLYGDRKNIVQKIQNTIPEGAKVVAWIYTPFYLDFTRNTIIDVDPAGLQSPWAKVSGASYLMWEYNGFATRTTENYQNEAVGVGKFERAKAYTSYKFSEFINELSKKGKVIYHDGRFGVVEIDAKTVFKP